MCSTPVLRVLLAAIIASDVWPNGVPNIGISKVFNVMSQLNFANLTTSTTAIYCKRLLSIAIILNLGIVRSAKSKVPFVAAMAVVKAVNATPGTNEKDSIELYESIVKWATVEAQHKTSTPPNCRFNKLVDTKMLN